MNYLSIIKEYDDMRMLNREAFKMEQVYQFKLEKYIQYYDYDLCDEKSDEYSESDKEYSHLDNSNDFDSDSRPPTEYANEPFGTGS